MNETEETIVEIARTVGLDSLQLHGDETPAMVRRLSRSFSVIKAIRVRKSFQASQLAPVPTRPALLLDGFDANQ